MASRQQMVGKTMKLLFLWNNFRSDFQALRFRPLSSQIKLLPILICVALTSGCNWVMYRGNALRNGRAVTDTSKLTGTVFWSVSSPGFGYFYIPSGPVVGSGPTIYAGGLDGNLYAFKSDGSLKWTYSTGITPGAVLTAAGIAQDGTVYATNGAVFAVSSSGTLKWKFVLPGPGIPFEPAIASDGTLYFGDQCGGIYALTPTGSVKWVFTEYQSPGCIEGISDGDPIGPAPAIAADGTIYAWVQNANVLVALTPAGSLKWIAGFSGDPVVGATTGTIYLRDGNHLTALNPDGSFKWQINVISYFSQPALGTDGTIYLGTNEQGLLAINPDGTVKWTYRSDLAFVTPTIGGDGTIYVPALDTVLHAVDPNGTVKWTMDWSSVTTCAVNFNEPAIGPDGTVYIIPDNGGSGFCNPVGPLIAVH